MGAAQGVERADGDFTFLMLDVEGSTALLARVGAEVCAGVFAEIHRIARRAVAAHRGVVFKTDGDGAWAAFVDPVDALHAAKVLIADTSAHPWTTEPRPRIRVVLHRGHAVVNDGEYVSMAIHQLARLGHAAQGDQAVATYAVVADQSGRVLADLVALGEFWVRDFSVPVRLYQVPTGVRGELAAPELPRADLTNITATAPSLIGRDALIADVRRALTASRLVTLVGPGGVGKTSVAVAVAQAVAEAGSAFWFVDLSAVDGSGEESSADRRVAGVLGRVIGAASDDADAVLSRLATRPVTLLLDNCEQVRVAVAQLVARILEASPGTAILATSREALRLPSELLVDVDPLPLDLAIKLFTDRARRAAPGFEVSAANEATLAELCRELDRLPLALELAASLTRHSSPQEILRRLSGRGTLPNIAAHGRPARHASLETLVESSLANCSPNELLVFRTLGAFAGPAPAAVVASVCEVEEWEAHDLLGMLVERSLATATVDDHGITRFGTLFTLRRAAQRRLRDAGDERALLLAHARWVVRAGRAAQETGGDALRDAEALVPEMLLALDRADVIGLELDETADLARNRVLRLGSRVPGLAWRLIEDILSRPDAPDLARSHAYALACCSDDLDSGAERFAERLEQGLAAARRAGDDDDLLNILLEKAAGGDGVAAATGAVSSMEWAALAEAEQILRRMGPRGRIWASIVHNAAGILHERAGNPEAARRRYLAALREAEACGNTHEVAREVFNLSDLEQECGQSAAAAKGFDAAAGSYAELEDHAMHAYASFQGALSYASLGDLALAGDRAADAVLAARRTGSRRLLAMTLFRAAEIAARAGEVLVAEAFVAEALSVAPDAEQASAAASLRNSGQP